MKESEVAIVQHTAFFDEKLFKTCGRLNIGSLFGGKLYANVKQAVEDSTDWRSFRSSGNWKIWQYYRIYLLAEKLGEGSPQSTVA